jgi:hypothetical protein
MQRVPADVDAQDLDDGFRDMAGEARQGKALTAPECGERAVPRALEALVVRAPSPVQAARHDRPLERDRGRTA